MILYHASPQVIDAPDIYHSREYLDFGKGFYLTQLREQADKYALRFVRRNGKAFIHEYELLVDISGFRVKRFLQYDEEWLDYVSACRLGKDCNNYDLVSGGIADDKVFNTIDLYFAGEIDRKDALKRLMYEKPNHQICILNQELAASLVLKSVIEVNTNWYAGK